jgi:hypothetical protein
MHLVGQIWMQFNSAALESANKRLEQLGEQRNAKKCGAGSA